MRRGDETVDWTLGRAGYSAQAVREEHLWVSVGKGEDYTIENNTITYENKLKDKVYNSFVEPEISRILASIKHADKINIESSEISSKLFYFFPKLNSDPALENFRKDLYSGKKTIEELNRLYSRDVADIVISEIDKSADKELKISRLVTKKINNRNINNLNTYDYHNNKKIEFITMGQSCSINNNSHKFEKNV